MHVGEEKEEIVEAMRTRGGGGGGRGGSSRVRKVFVKFDKKPVYRFDRRQIRRRFAPLIAVELRKKE